MVRARPCLSGAWWYSLVAGKCCYVVDCPSACLCCLADASLTGRHLLLSLVLLGDAHLGGLTPGHVSCCDSVLRVACPKLGWASCNVIVSAQFYCSQGMGSQSWQPALSSPNSESQAWELQAIQSAHCSLVL